MDMCLDGGQWYCLPDDRQLCPEEYLGSWSQMAPNEDAWHCSCGFGVRTVLENANFSSCLCHDGFYGKFCQWKSCGEGAVWSLWNRTCVEENGDSETGPAPWLNEDTDGGKGMLGFDLSSELLLASLLMAIFLVALLVLIRICARKLRCNRRPDDADYLERIAIDEFRARRSSRFRAGGANGGNDDGIADKAPSNDWQRKTNLPYWAPFNDMFLWRNGSSQNENQSARPLAFHRLTTVLEENSDVEESSA